MTKYTAHEDLLRSVLHRKLSEDEALLWMILFHTHAIHLRPGVLADFPSPPTGDEGVVLPPQTQRGCASVIAALWPDQTDKRADYTYWYFQYNTRTPYEALGDVPEDLMPRILALRQRVAQDPRVLAVVEED